MSSDGKYLAVGTWMSDDEYNEEDGSIQIWEVASGRCVNLLKDDYAGIGWLDYPCALQWSPDNKRLGVTLNTNQVSSFNPFGMTVKALATAGVTNGWDTPPAWCWIKDSSCFAISCFGNSELPLCICKTNMTRIDESNAKWFKEREGDSEANEEIEPEFQPYTVCHATRNSNLVFGYNNHEEIYGINIKTGQLAWELNSASPVGFSPLDDFFVYLEDEHIQIADLNTGKVKECIPNVESIQGFEFAPNSQRYAAYGENRITIWDYNKKVATFELDSSLLIQDYFECELRPIAFNTSGDKIVCLLDNGDIQVWSLKDGVPSKILTYPSKATGIYWGEALVGVSGEALIFFKEDGTLIRTCDKAAQIAAYNEVYDTVGSPLEIGDEDWMTYGDSSSLYPFKYKEQAEWLVALETGNIISSCKGLKELDPHLSYTWKNKYAWPVSWRKTTVYDTMAQAKVQHI